MTINNINEKQPDIDQYCFAKSGDEWVFCIFKGMNNGEYEWIIFRSIALGPVLEWQPAQLKMENPSVDLVRKKVIFDLTNVVNGEGETMYDEFISSIQIEAPNDCSDRIDCDLEDGGEIISPEISMLRPDCFE